MALKPVPLRGEPLSLSAGAWRKSYDLDNLLPC